MHSKKKEEIIQHLIAIAGKAEALDLGRAQPKRFQGENDAFGLSEQALQQYRLLGKLILAEQDWSAKFSEQYIYRAIDDLLVKARKLPDKDSVQPILDQLLADLSTFSDELAVYIPISGLSMDIESLEIGNLVFRKATEEFLEQLATQIGSVIYPGEKPDPPQQYILNHQRARLQRYKGKAVAEYHVVAEKTRAIERAMVECRRVLDLFWLFVPFSDSYSQSRFHISIESIRPLELSVLSENKFYDFNSQWRFLPFHLRGEIIHAMTDMGIFEVSHLLKKTEVTLTDFDKTLIRGIHWYAAGRAQTESENEFLNLVVCLETFLSPQSGESITTYIAEGLAIILAENVPDRLEIKKMMKNLYGMRSAISHGGQKVITDSDLMWLRIAVWHLTEWMIANRSRFNSRQDLCDWIELKKLGGP